MVQLPKDSSIAHGDQFFSEPTSLQISGYPDANSEVLLGRRRNPLPEHRTLDHISIAHMEERVHDCL